MKRISGLTLIVFLLLAASAHAGEVRLWACHGPVGEPLGSDAFLRAQVFDAEFGGGCTLPGSALTAGFTRADPNGQSEAKVIARVPPNVTLTAVTLDRQARGPGYSVGTLESEDAGAVLDGVATYAVSGDSVSLSVRCDAAITARCTGRIAAGFALRALALTVHDANAPMFAVGGTRSPAAGVLNLDVHANDAGLGLRSAAASIDGTGMALASFGGCPELYSPADTTADVALDGECVHVAQVALAVDTTAVADGLHTLSVTVTDVAGNTVTQAQQFEVANHVATPTATPIATATATATATAEPTATGPPPPRPCRSRALLHGAHGRAWSIFGPARTVPKPTTAGLVRLPKRVSRKGAYSVSVLCPASASKPCAHRLALKAGGKTIASGRGTSKPGKRAQIVLQLSAAARRTLARKGTLTATLTLSGATPTTVRLHG